LSEENLIWRNIGGVITKKRTREILEILLKRVKLGVFWRSTVSCFNTG